MRTGRTAGCSGQWFAPTAGAMFPTFLVRCVDIPRVSLTGTSALRRVNLQRKQMRRGMVGGVADQFWTCPFSVPAVELAAVAIGDGAMRRVKSSLCSQETKPAKRSRRCEVVNTKDGKDGNFQAGLSPLRSYDGRAKVQCTDPKRVSRAITSSTGI